MLASLRIEYEHANAQFRSDHATLFTKRNDTPQEIIGVPDGGENIKIFKDVSRVPNITLNFAQSQSNIISPLIFDFDTPTSECVSPNILSEFPFSIDDQSNHAFPQASSSVYGVFSPPLATIAIDLFSSRPS
ncbi:hypothetical protein DXG01_007824 [Tephrocybe rancida]|nr:hypothetical protein DXG01_007824 [Tephrocybe rancida]